MAIYVIMVIYILLLGIRYNRGRIDKKRFCTTVAVVLIVITGLRSISVGSDTSVYYSLYEDFKTVNLAHALSSVRDIGFYFVFWIFARLSIPFQAVCLLSSCVFYVPMMKMINKQSEDPVLSVLIILAFDFFQFSMTGMRQTMALGMVICMYNELLEEKPKYSKVIIFSIIGILLHRSCIVALFLLLVKICAKKGFIKLYLPIVFLSTFVFFRERISIVEFLNSISSDLKMQAMANNNMGGLTTLIVYILVCIFAWFILNKIDDERTRLLLCSFGVATVLQTLVTYENVLFRLCWYFSITIILLIPKAVHEASYNISERGLFHVVMCAMMLFMYFFITIGDAYALPYEFFF